MSSQNKNLMLGDVSSQCLILGLSQVLMKKIIYMQIQTISPQLKTSQQHSLNNNFSGGIYKYIYKTLIVMICDYYLPEIHINLGTGNIIHDYFKCLLWL